MAKPNPFRPGGPADPAVWAAHGWLAGGEPAPGTKETILARLMALNLERSGGLAGQTTGESRGAATRAVYG